MDLIKRLVPAGFERTGPRLYRLLRDLEQNGLVRSDWAGSAGGPQRRVYKLTAKGARQLHDDAKALHKLSQSLQHFFTHYASSSSRPKAVKAD